MKKLDAFEKEILDAYEKGELKSTSPSKAKLAKFKAAATATFLKEKRVNIHKWVREVNIEKYRELRCNLLH